jgi:hypothetical protein
MFYTKLVISEPVEQAYRAVITERWNFVPLTTSGGTKARRFASDGAWKENPTFGSYNSQKSMEISETKSVLDRVVRDNITFVEEIRVWESTAIAQDFVAAIQALNLAGVTVSYEGDTDPTAV